MKPSERISQLQAEKEPIIAGYEYVDAVVDYLDETALNETSPKEEYEECPCCGGHDRNEHRCWDEKEGASLNASEPTVCDHDKGICVSQPWKPADASQNEPATVNGHTHGTAQECTKTCPTHQSWEKEISAFLEGHVHGGPTTTKSEAINMLKAFIRTIEKEAREETFEKIESMFLCLFKGHDREDGWNGWWCNRCGKSVEL